MPVSRLLHFAVPLVLATILLAPVLALLIDGRDLQKLDLLDPGNFSPSTEWLLRLSTLGIVGLCLLLLVERGLRGDKQRLDTSQLLLLIGFLAFYCGTTLVPGIWGTVPELQRNFFYVLFTFLAVYARRGDGVAFLLEVAKWTLLLYLLISFPFAVLNPNAALRTYAAELRLPFVPFRFWGVGSSSNSIAPLALVLTLLVIAKPFPRPWINGLAHVAAAAVILLAQSQTTWISTIVIVPALLLYRRSLARGGSGRLPLPPSLLLVTAGGLGMALVIGAAVLLEMTPGRVEPTPGLSGYGDVMTGRGNIWRIAINVFLDNPLFGYGPTVWLLEFRNTIQMPFATSAHNQVLQSLSMGGLFGLAGLSIYLVVLARIAAQRAVATGGLAPALLTLTLIRGISETPLELGTLLIVDMAFHLLLFALLLDRSWSGVERIASTSTNDAPTRRPARTTGPHQRFTRGADRSLRRAR